MTRVEELAGSRYDLLVVGGGIHGLFAAYDAAARGLKVALVERADFGGGLSFNHQRTIHGGLRALERGRIRKTRQQIMERRAWARIAPHLLRSLPFLVGTYRWTKRSRWALRVGFTAYDFIGRKRNIGVSPELAIPKNRLESAAATRRLFPGVAEAGLTGGAIWYDYQTIHPDRLSWLVALAATRAGAHLVNYAEATGPLKSSGKVTGALVRDGLTGREFEVEAAVTLLAAGSGLGLLMQSFGVTGAPPLLRAMNILLDRPARDIATAAPAPSGRMLTAVPWRGALLCGTHQSDQIIERAENRPPDSAIDACLADINAAFPRVSATRRDVRLVHHGLVPASVRGARADLLAESQVLSHTNQGASGLFSLVGVKFTTARQAAERAVDAVAAEIGRRLERCRTATTPLPFADVADVEGRLVETLRDLKLSLDRDVLEHLGGWYGTEATDVVRYAHREGLLDRLAPGVAVLAGEIAFAAEHAKAVRLSDAVLRRTPLGSAGHPGRAALERAAQVMRQAREWSAEETAREMAAVEAVYPATSPVP
jgi:glycerol-3-phosphate dehydrogenase